MISATCHVYCHSRLKLHQPQHLELELRSTRYRLQTRDAEFQDFRTRSTNEIRDAADRIEKLRVVKDSLKGSQAHIVQLTESNRQLQRELDESNKEKQSSDALKAKLATNLEDLSKSRTEDKSLIKEAESELNTVKAELVALKNSHAQLEQENAKLSRTSAEAEKLSTAEANSKSRIADLEKHVGELKEKLSSESSASASHKTELATVKKAQDTTEQQNIKLTQELEQTRSQLKQVKSANGELFLSKDNLQKKLEELDN